ncbi:hypothetical protein Taro_004580, partial [Colocasia esculenta]|nr:hypothetical protein [Colocasia esculenta]
MGSKVGCAAVDHCGIVVPDCVRATASPDMVGTPLMTLTPVSPSSSTSGDPPCMFHPPPPLFPPLGTPTIFFFLSASSSRRAGSPLPPSLLAPHRVLPSPRRRESAAAAMLAATTGELVAPPPPSLLPLPVLHRGGEERRCRRGDRGRGVPADISDWKRNGSYGFCLSTARFCLSTSTGCFEILGFGSK